MFYVEHKQTNKQTKTKNKTNKQTKQTNKQTNSGVAMTRCITLTIYFNVEYCKLIGN